jgi:LmbE family N-acetylglucosaminyl deacetylase
MSLASLKGEDTLDIAKEHITSEPAFAMRNISLALTPQLEVALRKIMEREGFSVFSTFACDILRWYVHDVCSELNFLCFFSFSELMRHSFIAFVVKYQKERGVLLEIQREKEREENRKEEEAGRKIERKRKRVVERARERIAREVAAAADKSQFSERKREIAKEWQREQKEKEQRHAKDERAKRVYQKYLNEA